MRRARLFDNYISDRFISSTDFSKKKIKLEYCSYLRNYKKYLPEDKKANILEIGFGTGYFLKFLLEKGYENIYGIELSKEEVEFVKKNICNNVEFVPNTQKFLDNHKDTYDFIYMSQVLEHIPKKETVSVLVKVKNALKKDGLFIANTPNCNNPLNTRVLGADFTHEFIFNPESLGQVCKIAKFSSVKILPFKEENLSFHSKITNITSPIFYFIINLFIGFNRCYLSPSGIYSANIYCLCRK